MRKRERYLHAMPYLPLPQFLVPSQFFNQSEWGGRLCPDEGEGEGRGESEEVKVCQKVV